MVLRKNAPPQALQPPGAHHDAEVPRYERDTWHCSVLRNACLTVLAAQPGCSVSCSRRPFRIDVYGPEAQSAARRVLQERRFLRDPVESFHNRHLERDVFANQTGLPPTPVRGGEGPTMLWPFFEQSYGDFWRDTMIPLGHLLTVGQLPPALAFSGLPTGSGALARTNALDGLVRIRRVCTFERETTGVPRCESACYASLPICEINEHGPVRGPVAWRAMTSLDAALGFDPPDLLAGRALAAEAGTLRVMLAARFARRFITNLPQLVAACDGLVLGGWTLRCEARNLARANLADVVATMRRVDVFVSMHGGDCVNALHMRPGRTVIELVNHGFEQANWRWLDQYARLLKHTFRLRRVVLPKAADEAPSPPLCARKGCANLTGDERAVTSAWNANGTLPWPLLRAELAHVVGNATAALAAPARAAVERRVWQEWAAAALPRAVNAPAAAASAPQPIAGTPPPAPPMAVAAAGQPPPPLFAPRKLAVLIPYLGTLPLWLPVTLATMSGPNAKDVNFFIVGDSRMPEGVVLPHNVHLVRATWEDFRRRAAAHLGVQIKYDSPAYACEGCLLYSTDRATANASTALAEAEARRQGKLIHHTSKITDLKPFMAALFPELLRSATWWAWGDVDVLWGDLPRFIDAVPPSASFVCPLTPNPWGVTTWGPFTAWRLSHNTTSLFRYSRKWQHVLTNHRPMQFDEWWGSGSHDWRMSHVVARLVDEGRLGAQRTVTPVAEAKSCKDPCTWCPCGAYAFAWSAVRSAEGPAGLRVNGGTEVILLHLAAAKKAWGAATPRHTELAGCLRGRLGILEQSSRSAPVIPAPQEHNRPSHATADHISFGSPVHVTVCESAVEASD